jgi:hypothetical protein
MLRRTDVGVKTGVLVGAGGWAAMGGGMVGIGFWVAVFGLWK